MNNLFDALQGIQDVSSKLDGKLFIVALLASLAAALAASALYRFFYESRGTGSQVHRSFPLLAISITTIFVCVQLSLPLSLGLLGALSIIRFRTPIKEPEEVGFIMLVIAASIASATFNFQFMVILYAVAVASLFLIQRARTWKHFQRDGIMILTLADSETIDHLPKVIQYISDHTRRSTLESSSTRNGVTNLQFSFSGLRTDVPAFQNGIRDLTQIDAMNIFFNRPGGIR